MPSLQLSPAAHAGPCAPHVQTPLEQASAPGPQLTHPAPPVPQRVVVSSPNATQVPPLQQPWQCVASHWQ
jgi:hypothetical protein